MYHLRKEQGLPFREDDELMEKSEDKKQKNKENKVVVSIDKEGIQSRIEEVPVSAGNYSYIDLNDKAIYIMSRETGIYANSNIKVLSISNEDIKLNDMASDVSGFELTRDGKKFL